MHKYFMQAALEQAWLGRGSCAPNPSVGAVAVYQGEIIARAWHKGAGTAHAEQLILQQIPEKIKNLMLYVTLEPCNHWGKTPPCVSGLINYGVSQVIYGYSDPNPLVVANNTPQLLKERGIAVVYYPLPEIEAFYQSYHYWILTKKPWVTAKLAISLDGKIAGRGGQRVYLTNNACSEFTHNQRQYTDVILTTAQTIRADDPSFNVRKQGFEQGKIVAILDRRLVLSNEAKVFSTAKHCHIYYDKKSRVVHPHANCTYHVVPEKNGLLDLPYVIKHLGELGFYDVWVEAGGQLFSALHREEILQRTYLYIAPSLLGFEALPAFIGETVFRNQPKVNWQIKGDNVIACFEWQGGLCLQD